MSVTKRKPSKNFWESETVLTLAKFLRESRSSELKTTEGVCYGKRVDYFNGKDFIDSLQKGKYKDVKLREKVKHSSQADLVAIGTQMLQEGFFHRAQIVYKSKKEDKVHDDLDKLDFDASKTFEIDGVYAWILPVSQTRLFLMSFGLLIGAITICLFKVWPLWAKIGVWWISVILLVSMISIFSIRILLAAVFWIIGFRGLWLFPNLFDDDIGVLETFTPLFGYGRLVEEAKRRKKEKKEKKEREGKGKELELEKEQEKNSKPNQSKKNSGNTKDTVTKETEPVSPKEPQSEKNDQNENSWRFGFINFAIIMILGLVVCNQLGILAGENIPEFLISQKDIWNTYPSLLAAPPAFDANETLPEETVKEEPLDEEEDAAWKHLEPEED